MYINQTYKSIISANVANSASTVFLSSICEKSHFNQTNINDSSLYMDLEAVICHFNIAFLIVFLKVMMISKHNSKEKPLTE